MIEKDVRLQKVKRVRDLIELESSWVEIMCCSVYISSNGMSLMNGWKQEWKTMVDDDVNYDYNENDDYDVRRYDIVMIMLVMMITIIN